jgi:prevent-host-death family protein
VDTIDIIDTVMSVPTTPLTSTDPTPITAMQLRRGSGKLLDRVFYKSERFVVQKAGEPRAVIVPLREYREMQRRKAEAKKRFFATAEEPHSF